MALAELLFKSTSYLRLGPKERVEKLRAMGWPESEIDEIL